MDDQKLENLNQIDINFSGVAEEDSFEDVTNKNNADSTEAVKTGIILHFDDDETDFTDTTKVSSPAQAIYDKHIIDKPADNANMIDYNKIDLDCKYGDDDDIDAAKYAKPKKLVFDDVDDLDFKELVLDKSTPPQNKNISDSELEDIYWKHLNKKTANINMKHDDQELLEEISHLDEDQKVNLKNILKDLQKKHAQSNKKGAMGQNFHLVGNIEKEHSFFDSAMGNPSGSSKISSGDTTSGNITGVSSAASEGNGGGMGESLIFNNYSKTLREVFDIIGFDVQKNKDETFLAKDQVNNNNIIKANNLAELIYALQPFINYCVILPLSAATKQKFTSYIEWCDWYKSGDNSVKFNEFANDIKYCDLLANHLDECEL